MSYHYYIELKRLEQENTILLEQVRTLSAEQAGKHRTAWRILLANGEESLRPAHETAYARKYVTDAELSNLDALGYLAEQLKRSIEETAKDRTPLDYMWRMTLERDYVK